MKKSTRAILATCVAILFFSNLFSNIGESSVQKNQDNQLLNYVWYKDEELTDIVGTVSEINVECKRLKTLFPAYLFVSSPGPGLLPFEWGVFGSLPPVVIYSNFF